jgi:hypothetical protein
MDNASNYIPGRWINILSLRPQVIPPQNLDGGTHSVFYAFVFFSFLYRKIMHSLQTQ